MLEEYRALVRATSMRDSPPALEFYDDLHGVGGMFVVDDWMIMIGVRDMQNVAADLLQRWRKQLTDLYMVGHGGQWPTPAELHAFAVEVATRRCMAHEIGHALISSGAPNPYKPDEEAGADYYAGRLDAIRGNDKSLGMMFFFSIGCVGVSCAHPTPNDRAAAYTAGYDEQKRAA
jgi:hypothetical protein